MATHDVLRKSFARAGGIEGLGPRSQIGPLIPRVRRVAQDGQQCRWTLLTRYRAPFGIRATGPPFALTCGFRPATPVGLCP